MELSKILRDNNFKFNKQFGQNFITDTNLLKAIVLDSKVSTTDTVIEIGAGGGTLTKCLCEKAKNVISYEIDNNLKPILAQVLKDCDNVELRFCDILSQQMADIEKGLTSYRVVANLPYYITTPIIMKFLEESEKVESLTIMVQKEVADRLCAKYNSKDYGTITIAIDVKATAKLTREVNRQMFYPVPNVDSAVVLIEIVKDKYKILNTQSLSNLIRYSFAMRRKTLVNNLLTVLNIDKVAILNILEKMSLKADIRGEALSPLQFVNLSNYLFENNLIK